MLSDEGTYPITLGLSTVLAKGSSEPARDGTAIVGVAVSVVPRIARFLCLQRDWRLDLLGGGRKG